MLYYSGYTRRLGGTAFLSSIFSIPCLRLFHATSSPISFFWRHPYTSPSVQTIPPASRIAPASPTGQFPPEFLLLFPFLYPPIITLTPNESHSPRHTQLQLTPSPRCRRRQHRHRLPPRRTRTRHHHPIGRHLLRMAADGDLTTPPRLPPHNAAQSQPHRHAWPRRLHFRSPPLPESLRWRGLYSRRRCRCRGPDGESLGSGFRVPHPSPCLRE